MSIVEGKGMVPPKPIAVPVSRSNILGLLPIALAQSAKYKHGRDLWRRGIVTTLPGEWGLGNAVPPYAVGMLIAKLGEWAFVETVNRRIGRRLIELDVTVKEHGDNGIDAEMPGLAFQVKTDRGNWNVGLVRRVKGRFVAGRTVSELVPMPADIHVFTRWTGGTHVYLLGWMWTKDVRESPFGRAKRDGKWWNLEVPYQQLQPMCRLFTVIGNKEHQWH